MSAIEFIQHHIQHHKSISNELWNSLEQEIMSKFPQFKNKVYTVARLSIIQYRVCMLIKCGFAPAEIAIALGRSRSTIANIRYRLYLRAFPNGNENFHNWDKFILST